MPHSKINSCRLKSPPWWNDDCDTAVKERRKALKRLAECPDRARLDDFKSARRRCSECIQEAKRIGWRKLVGSFNCKTSTHRIWSLIKSFRRNKNPPSNQDNNLDTVSLAAIEKLCPPFCPYNDHKHIEDMKREDLLQHNTQQWLEEPFSRVELTRAINVAKKRSAPGLDQIDHSIISSLPDEYITRLLELYNQILAQGVIPDSWKDSLVVLIPKTDGKSVRPISLLSCFAKLMEYMIYFRLRWFIESRPLLPQTQSGFRPTRSCIDNLVTLTSNIRTGFIRRSPTVAVFLDIAGAFDNVIPHILIRDLYEIGIPASIRKFIENFISMRRLHFVVDGSLLGPFNSYKGTPQGSTLSPALFNIYLKDINDHIHSDSRILQYADDVVIYSTLRNIDSAISSVQKSIDNINTCLRYRDLELSPSKSRYMIFSRIKSCSEDPNIQISNTHIPRAYTHKFLGVVLDDKLSGIPQLKALIERGKNIANIISSLAGVKWGSHPDVLLTVYRATLRSAIEYGAQIFTWNPESENFVKLLRIQYKAIRKAMGYRISTPINAMLSEAREPPLHLRFSYITSKYIYKAMANKFSTSYEALKELELTAIQKNQKLKTIKSSNLFKSYITHLADKKITHRATYPPAFWHEFEVMAKPITYIGNMLLFHSKDDPHATAAISYEISLEYRIDAISIYTDGSKEPDSAVGARVYSPDLNISIKHKLPSETSIFSAELWALYQAVLLARDCGSNKVVIFSDSKSALDAVSNHHYIQNNYIVYYIKQNILLAMQQGITITLFWIPSHVGIPGNEKADETAKSASLTGLSTAFRIPYEELYAVSKERLHCRFTEYLNSSAGYKDALNHEYFPRTSSKPWFNDLSWSRNEIVMINRLRSNHYNLNSSLHRVNIVESPACPCGNNNQDINHVIFQCEVYKQNSLHLRNYLKSKFPQHPENIFPALSNPSPKLCRLLTTFAGASDLFF
ncbi:PREDICTED: RNA-directed DNA polymerase from mobile element jockey-like [Trachymyrmex cornetzi]|uniref:RNA-directed DNA polymerase from mobile element jockey-like n=1 Tax=Trachymyrmex cornetzi TaxID=471704 RepID=UPI00084F1E22|nr:PREDICTED: RNA-directed DNA polymerase from mobile element jockey-like [Trachymyrmex cornetzi]